MARPSTVLGQKLLDNGVESLDEAELLAVVGRLGGSALEKASGLLDRSGGLGPLLASDPSDLHSFGLNPTTRVALLAIAELNRRWSRERIRRHPLRNPAAVVDYLGRRYPVGDQEVFGALFLDSKQRLVSEREIFRGSLDHVVVEPRQVFREALRQRATGVLVFHNHPSGDPTPSAEDWGFTRRLAAAGELLGIRLVDHLVVGDPGRWISMVRLEPW